MNLRVFWIWSGKDARAIEDRSFILASLIYIYKGYVYNSRNQTMKPRKSFSQEYYRVLYNGSDEKRKENSYSVIL